MKTKGILFMLLLSMYLCVEAVAQTMPLVYDVENTGANCPVPYLPSFNELPAIGSLPDPFMWADGRGRISNFFDWRYRRAEIGTQIQNYEIGVKPPRPDSITATYSNDTLKVYVTVNSQTLTLTSKVISPAGSGPFPAVIGINFPTGSIPDSIFKNRNIAEIAYTHNQVTTYGNPQTTDPYYRLYPYLNPTNTGQYSAWAWGVSRIIDGLELVQDSLPIDLKHIAVTGCSYAGKLALFAGAFDERIALTIAQESGGGGATSWRYSHASAGTGVEEIDNTDYNWFMDSMHQFAGDNVYRLPEDHHELMAMVAPRALYATANPDYTWLSNPSCNVASKAAQKVYEALGISDRFGFSIVGGHSHCQVPSSQIPEIVAFVDKFLLGKENVNTSNISDSPYSIDLSSWIPWTTPTLSNDTSFFGKTMLVYPPDFQKDLDTTVTFKWNKAGGAEKYSFQISKDPTLKTVDKSDTTTDTVKTITGLLEGKQYYWRVQVISTVGPGPWSDIWHLRTSIPLPAMPELDSVAPYPGRDGWFRFTWNKSKYADQYLIQTSVDTTFASVFVAGSTSDTTKVLSGFSAGQQYYWRVQASNIEGAGPWSNVSSFPEAESGVKEKEGMPTDFALSQNYPNPFNPGTNIRFAVPVSSFVTLKVYDILGREVAILVHEKKAPGRYEVNFDAGKFSSGVYFYKLQAGNYAAWRKMLLTK
ncbi:MAG: T9SS type A sorting domain-containing protein [Bacteroidota bacterium]|nr:T9SS type A sorting domain-containing protein [Bacteroidota bacterium]